MSNTHSLQALKAEQKELGNLLDKYDGEVSYFEGMAEMYKKMAREVEDKLSDIGQAIICLENA